MNMQELIATLKANLEQTDINLYPGASEQQLRHFEQAMGLILPADFKTLYRFCNGFESDEEMFRIIPLEEIIERKDQSQPPLLVVAEYMIYADLWEVKIEEPGSDRYQITTIDWYGNPILLTNSLTEFINRFLRGGMYGGGGLAIWPAEVKALNK